ncbi:MAG: tripartite tricarboxylate transporter substrate binding protein [Ramlibacter sp.]
MKRKAFAAYASTILVAPWLAQAEEIYPSRAIRIIVPSAPGSGSDVVGRVLAERLSRALGQPVTVDNKPGSSGIIANGEAARSRPDGYTLLYCGFASMVVNPWFYKKLPYRPFEDFAPIARIGSGGVVLVANPQLKVEDIHELVEWARRQKAPPAFATWGVGSSAQAAMEQIARTTGVKFEHVVYKSIPQLLQDVVAGQIQIGWADPSAPLGMIAEGQLRALGIASLSRAPRLPSVPTLLEQKIPVDLDGWSGLYARSGTPPAIVDKLRSVVLDIVRDPQFVSQLHALNLNESPPLSPAQFTQLMKSDTQRWGELARRMGVEPQ